MEIWCILLMNSMIYDGVTEFLECCYGMVVDGFLYSNHDDVPPPDFLCGFTFHLQFLVFSFLFINFIRGSYFVCFRWMTSSR